MTINELEDVIKQMLIEIQALGGKEVPYISGTTQPLQDLEGLDSVNIVELIVELPTRLGLDYEISPRVLIPNSYDRHFSISEIAKRLYAFILTKE
jgi:acyl carrier protein